MTGCVQKMSDQPKYHPLDRSRFFKDGAAARPVVAGTVPSGYGRNDTQTGSVSAVDENTSDLPFPVTQEVSERGQQRYNIYCAVCHARTGDGDGMIVRRGFSAPPSLHEDRLRAAPVGHFYEVITKGYGAMGSYAVQVTPQDRWAIISYIRALQLSRHASLDDVPPDERQRLEAAGNKQ